MKRRVTPLIGLALVAALAMAAEVEAGQHRLGFGMHYWKSVDEIQDSGFAGLDDIEDDGVSQVFSYQYIPKGFLKWELAVEYFSKGFGGSTEKAYSPQLYLLFGRGIYAGLGVGVTISDGFGDSSTSDPFYGARLGFEMGILPRLDLDISTEYRFNAWSELESQVDDFDSEVWTLSAVLRLTL